MNIFAYKNPEVRDLAAACFDPPLMISAQLMEPAHSVANCGLGLTPTREDWLRALDENPQPLREHIANIRGRRLGIYFEGLWHFFLLQDEAVDLVAHNLPVRDGSTTLGEFDCIYYCHQRQRHFHLELAVKYFLGNRSVTTTEQASHWHEWWGPGCQDRLDLKIGHMMERQILLADQPAAKACLSKLGIDEVAREVEIKGYLFQSMRDSLPPPRAYNGERAFGAWVHRGDLLKYTTATRCQHFVVLPKLQWLALARVAPDAETLDSSRLHYRMQNHFDRGSRAQLVAALDSGGIEVTRFFVVGNNLDFSLDSRKIANSQSE